LVTVSIGLAEFDPRHPPEGDLLVSADRALYRAKAAGRNVVA
jgi:PleD family two-component response regulator